MLLNNNDFKYIIKKVIIFLLIFLFISFFNSCEVHAQTYNIKTNEVLFYTSGGGTLSGSVDTLYTNNNVQSYYAFRQSIELGDSSAVLFPGQYLIEFYVYSNSSTLSSRENCSILSSNFENINMTTGNWVANEITSQCVDIYATTYNGKNAYRILYKFNYNGARTGADGITELRFLVNSSPNDFFYGNTYALASSNIYDYDIGIIEQFNQYKQNQTIISQNGQIISGLDTLNTSQNNNTNSIINNNNQNTQDIIDNQNSNTDKEIESQQVCYSSKNLFDKNNIINGYYYNADLQYISSNDIRLSDYIEVISGQTYTLSYTKNVEMLTNIRINYFNDNKVIQQQLVNSESTTGRKNYSFTIPNNIAYIRFSYTTLTNYIDLDTIQLEQGSSATDYEPYGEKICKNGNQVMNDSINDLNDNINDDNVDGANSQVDDLLNNSAFTDNSGIQSIINAPLNFINGLTNSCSPINITIPYINSDLSIPCIKQELTNHVPSLVPILSTAINGFVIYRILIDIVYLVKSSRNPDDDRIEVLDL